MYDWVSYRANFITLLTFFSGVAEDRTPEFFTMDFMITTLVYKGETLTIPHKASIKLLTEYAAIRNSLLGRSGECSLFIDSDIAIDDKGELCDKAENKDILAEVQDALGEQNLCRLDSDAFSSFITARISKCSISKQDFNNSDKQFSLQFGIYDGFLYPDFELCDGGSPKCTNYPKGHTGIKTHLGMLGLPGYQLKTYYSSSQSTILLEAPSKVRTFKPKPLSRDLVKEYNDKFENFQEKFFDGVSKGSPLELNLSKKLYSALYVKSEQTKKEFQNKPITIKIDPTDHLESIFGDNFPQCKNNQDYSNIRLVFKQHIEANYCVSSLIEVALQKNLTKTSSFTISSESENIFDYLTNLDGTNVSYKVVKGASTEGNTIDLGTGFNNCIAAKIFPSGNPGKDVSDTVVIQIPFMNAPDLEQSLKDSLTNLVYDHELLDSHQAQVLAGCYFYLGLDSIHHAETTGKVSLEVGAEG